MAGQVEQLRNFIQGRLDNSDKVSLVDAVAYFDYYHHAIPSTWRLNQALAELTVPVMLSLDGLHLARCGNASSAQLSDSDMSRIVEEYMIALRAKPTSEQTRG